MKTMDFVELCLNRGKSITSKNGRGWGIYAWKRFAKLTSLIDYGCDFKKGSCKDNKYNRRRKQGCCGGCASNIGYLNDISNLREDLTKTARLYNKKTGFWRKGRGCSLPRELRSITCLGHMCHKNLIEREGVLSRPAMRLLKLIEGKPPKNFNSTLLMLEQSLQNDKARS